MASYGGSSSSNPTRMVTFKTSDDEEVQVPEAIAMESEMVRGFFDGNPDEVENADPFPLPNVRGSIFGLLWELVCPKLEFDLEFEALKKREQEFKSEFFGRHTDETIVELVKAADYMRIEKVLDFMMPSVRKRFGLGDDKDADYVYSAEFETILLRRAASGSGGPGTRRLR